MTSKIRKGVVIDTGILIDYYTRKLENEHHRKYIEYLENEIYDNQEYEELFLSFLSRTELLYLICRLKGWIKGREYVENLLEDYTLVRNESLDEIAATLKCNLSISLADCYVIATGILFGIPVFFSEEKELSINVQERIRREFAVDLHIIRKYKEIKNI